VESVSEHQQFLLSYQKIIIYGARCLFESWLQFIQFSYLLSVLLPRFQILKMLYFKIIIFFYYILQKEELDLLKGKSDKDLWEEDLELFLKTLDVSHE